MEKYLEVHNLKKVYKKKKKELTAVNSISFDGCKGEIIGILGPNGSGKTTTMKSIATIIDFDEGDVSLFDLNVKKKRRKILSEVGTVLEGARNIHWRLTPMENLIYYAGLKGRSKKEILPKAKELLKLLDLEDVANKQVREFSRGMQQKVAIACALIHDPKVIMLDEPTLGLDIETARAMTKFIKDMAGKDKLILITSHDMKFIEAVCTKVHIIKDGNLIASDTIENLKNYFDRKVYKISSATGISEKAVKQIKDFGSLRISQNGHYDLYFTIKNPQKIYQLFKILENENIEILNMEIINNDFEDVFLEIIKEKNEVEYVESN